MTTFRADASWSSLYALQEEVFMTIADDKDKNKGEGVYKMLKKEKELLDTFMYAVNTGSKRSQDILLIAGISLMQGQSAAKIS